MYTIELVNNFTIIGVVSISILYNGSKVNDIIKFRL